MTPVVSIDVVGDAAVAKLELVGPGTLVSDCMPLLKVGSRWVIVNKIFSRGTR